MKSSTFEKLRVLPHNVKCETNFESQSIKSLSITTLGLPSKRFLQVQQSSSPLERK